MKSIVPVFFVAAILASGLVPGSAQMNSPAPVSAPVEKHILPSTSMNRESDYGLLLARAATNDPATLQAFYPGLLVSTVTNSRVVIRTNVTAYATNYTTNVVLTYHNTLLNVFTNYYAPTSKVTAIITNAAGKGKDGSPR
jgi:hypothetical protein